MRLDSSSRADTLTPDMPAANLQIDSSQFPEKVRRDLLSSLRRGVIQPKFHYDSLKQTLLWLQLHEAHSPARRDRGVKDAYDLAFAAATRACPEGKSVRLVGLGCGGGQKDAQLLRHLLRKGRRVDYHPVDVSAAMTLVARGAALRLLQAERCHPVVCDLAAQNNLPGLLPERGARVITFFGVIPNFEPNHILPRLTGLLRPGDLLLFSANLAPGLDYAAGMKRILGQYDNVLTRQWLLAFLLDLGVQAGDGHLTFGIETGQAGLKRVVADFQFIRNRTLQVHGREFSFQPGREIRLFFSYRHTPERMKRLLERHGLRVENQWASASGEEGLFLCRQSPDSPALKDFRKGSMVWATQ